MCVFVCGLVAGVNRTSCRRDTQQPFAHRRTDANSYTFIIHNRQLTRILIPDHRFDCDDDGINCPSTPTQTLCGVRMCAACEWARSRIKTFTNSYCVFTRVLSAFAVLLWSALLVVVLSFTQCTLIRNDWITPATTHGPGKNPKTTHFRL